MKRLLVPMLIAALMMVAGVAHAAWLATGSGSASSTAGTLPQGNTPSTSLSSGNAVVTWTEITTPTVDGYLVARYDAGGATATIGSNCNANPVVGGTCNEASVPEGRWQYTVQPQRGNWLGAESAKGAQLHVPTKAPTNLVATGASATINSTWTDNSQVETGYRVERSADGTDWTTLAAVDLAADSTGYSDSTLSCGTTRHYRIKALSAANGDSAYSATANAATDPCATATTMSVAMDAPVTGSSGNTGNWRWSAAFAVTVTDELGDPVSGATVTGSWSFEGGNTGQQGGATGGEPSCTTTASGTCSATRSGMHAEVIKITWTIDDVTKSGLSYTSPTPKPSKAANKP